MRRSKVSLAALLLSTQMGFSTTAFATGPVAQLGYPTFAGNGCSDETASAVLSPDGSTLTVLFDSYLAEAGGQSGTRLDRKICEMEIPVEVPSGYKVAIVEAEYRGFIDLPKTAQSSLVVDFTLERRPGKRVAHRWHGPMQEDFYTLSQMRDRDLVWTSCGGVSFLQINSSIMVASNGHNEPAMVAVDSADVKGALTYQLMYARCGAYDRPGHGGGYRPAPPPGRYRPRPAPRRPQRPVPPGRGNHGGRVRPKPHPHL